GIGRSLEAAHDAAMLAHTRDVIGAVEHIDPLSIKRMLIGWYAQESLQEIASGLLEPLREADRSGELVRTLRCFLDSESNVTTTAAILGLHRNTVLNRLRRIRALLQADLDRPDERLAVHLAVRTADSHGRDAV
ncbi:MAG TPA: helix-turn-helix domain-containing protein, partial [Nakamurella sp.]